jgi:hypothetical protein
VSQVLTLEQSRDLLLVVALKLALKRDCRSQANQELYCLRLRVRAGVVQTVVFDGRLVEQRSQCRRPGLATAVVGRRLMGLVVALSRLGDRRRFVGRVLERARSDCEGRREGVWLLGVVGVRRLADMLKVGRAVRTGTAVGVIVGLWLSTVSGSRD